MAENGSQKLDGQWAEYCHGDGYDGYGNRCVGYADSAHPCNKCCAMNELHNSAGFMETMLNMQTDNFPVSLIAYRGEKAIPVLHVRMDSIRAVESNIAGYVDVQYEGYGTDVTGTIPMVDYYTTDTM